MPTAAKPLAFSREELEALTDQWSDKEIAIRFNLAYSAVRKARIHFGIKTFTQKTGMVRIAATGELRPKGSVRGAKRKDGLDDEFFKVINNKEKAYWLGALFSDGWVTLRDGKPKEVGLAVKQSDEQWLKDFQESIGHTGKIAVKENKKSLSKTGLSTLCVLRVTCQRFTRYAIEAGVIPRKSGFLKAPDIQHALVRHFVRGLFDGDGSIGEKNFALICNNLSFCNEIKNLIEKHTGIALRISSPCSPVTGKPVYRLTGYRKDKHVLTWLYQDQSPVLARKYEKFSRFWS